MPRILLLLIIAVAALDILANTVLHGALRDDVAGVALGIASVALAVAFGRREARR